MPAIVLIVRPGDDVPIYRQIVRQVQHAIANQHLLPGQRLPSHRELSKQLVIAPLTVKHAYDELEHAGFVRSERGRGTFVEARKPVRNQKARLDDLRPQVHQLLHEAHLRGVDSNALVKLLQKEAESLNPAPKQTPPSRKDRS